MLIYIEHELDIHSTHFLLLLLMPSSPERSCQRARAIRRGEGTPEEVQVR